MRKEADELRLEESLKSNSRQPAAWCSLGEIRLRSGRLMEARAAFENALRMDGNTAQAHFGLAGVCKQEGKPAEAIASYRNGLRHCPESSQVLLDLGVLLAEQGAVDEAIECWQKLLCVEPQHSQALHNLGVAMAQTDKPDEAIRYLQQALTLRPDYAEAHFNLANVLCNQKTRENDRRSEGVEHYFAAIRIRPNYIESLFNLGCVLTDLNRSPEATIWLEQAARLGELNSPPHTLTASAYNLLGLALCMQAKYDEARTAYHRALALRPDLAEAHCNLGNHFQELGRLPEALACYELAIIQEKQPAVSKWNRSLSLLQSGNFEQGWREYEWRWERKQTPPRPFKEPRWDGSLLNGRTLLIHMEQGLGDMVQFVRFAAQAKGRGGRILVECPGFLAPLLNRCPGVDEIIPEGVLQPGQDTPNAPRFDVQIPVMSLPYALGTTLATLPADVPYVHVDPALIEQWGERLKACLAEITPKSSQVLKVGIAWQGNPNHRLDRYRSIPLTEFTPLARIPGVRLVSLQKGPGAAQIQGLPSMVRIWEPPQSDQMTAQALLDTAALMKNLDLVISVDTGTAHLAGALGMHVWVPLSAIGEWRWLLHREDSPWYPAMRLFRQKKLGAWRPVFKRMARELTKLVTATHSRKRGMPDGDPIPGKLEIASLTTQAEKSLPGPPTSPLPVQAGHVELSAIASAVDDPGKSSDRLLEIALRAVAHARNASMDEIVGRMKHPPYYPDVWPGEHYKLLAGVMTACKPQVVVEIGTATGLSALAMRSALPKESRLVTFDLVPWQRFAETHLRQEDFFDPGFSQVIGDLSDIQVMRQHFQLLQAAEFIFVDGPKDGHFERVLLQRLSDLGLPRSPLIMLDDIRVWNMLAIWREIRRPKLDLTSFGHWSGTGLIDWTSDPD